RAGGAFKRPDSRAARRPRRDALSGAGPLDWPGAIAGAGGGVLREDRSVGAADGRGVRPGRPLYIPTGGHPTCLPPLHWVWQCQAGYRWHGGTGERIADWRDDWLVVAYEGARPYILETGTGRILFALAGAGKWRPKEVFPDIFTMAAGLGTVGKVYVEVGE